MITYAVDITKKSGSQYKAGEDMHWDFGCEFDTKREAVRWCKKVTTEGGARVDRLNDDDDAIAAAQTVYVKFADGIEQNIQLEFQN